jgi:hypothetical protein
MGKQIEQIVLRSRNTNAHEEMFNILSHKGNTNQNYTKISSHPSQIGHYQGN